MKHIPSSWESNSEGTGLKSRLESVTGGSRRCPEGSRRARWTLLSRHWPSTRLAAPRAVYFHVHFGPGERGNSHPCGKYKPWPKHKDSEATSIAGVFQMLQWACPELPARVSRLAAQKSREIRRKKHIIKGLVVLLHSLFLTNLH